MTLIEAALKAAGVECSAENEEGAGVQILLGGHAFRAGRHFPH
ncbi:hypothetical protein [Roseomonas sp. WA12]